MKYIKRKTKYELMEDYTVRTPIIGYTADIPMIRLTPIGVLTVRAGFGFDPSGPTIDNPPGIFASCAHDAFYRLMRLGLVPVEERGKVDDFFGDQLDQAGMNSVRAAMWEAGVEVFASASADPANCEKVIEVKE